MVEKIKWSDLDGIYIIHQILLCLKLASPWLHFGDTFSLPSPTTKPRGMGKLIPDKFLFSILHYTDIQKNLNRWWTQNKAVGWKLISLMNIRQSQNGERPVCWDQLYQQHFKWKYQSTGNIQRNCNKCIYRGIIRAEKTYGKKFKLFFWHLESTKNWIALLESQERSSQG